MTNPTDYDKTQPMNTQAPQGAPTPQGAQAPQGNPNSAPQDWSKYSSSQQRRAWKDQQRAMRDYAREAWRNGYPTGNWGWGPGPQGQQPQLKPYFRHGPHAGLIVWGVIFFIVGCGLFSSTFHLPFLFFGTGRYFWPGLITLVGLVVVIIAIISGIRNSHQNRKAEAYWAMRNSEQDNFSPYYQWGYQEAGPQSTSATSSTSAPAANTASAASATSATNASNTSSTSPMPADPVSGDSTGFNHSADSADSTPTKASDAPFDDSSVHESEILEGEILEGEIVDEGKQ
jgi:hypothetical protein